jgi:hypothetical protein
MAMLFVGPTAAARAGAGQWTARPLLATANPVNGAEVTLAGQGLALGPTVMLYYYIHAYRPA